MCVLHLGCLHRTLQVLRIYVWEARVVGTFRIHACKSAGQGGVPEKDIQGKYHVENNRAVKKKKLYAIQKQAVGGIWHLNFAFVKNSGKTLAWKQAGELLDAGPSESGFLAVIQKNNSQGGWCSKLELQTNPSSMTLTGTFYSLLRTMAGEEWFFSYQPLWMFWNAALDYGKVGLHIAFWFYFPKPTVSHITLSCIQTNIFKSSFGRGKSTWLLDLLSFKGWPSARRRHSAAPFSAHEKLSISWVQQRREEGIMSGTWPLFFFHLPLSKVCMKMQATEASCVCLYIKHIMEDASCNKWESLTEIVAFCCAFQKEISMPHTNQYEIACRKACLSGDDFACAEEK